MLKYIYHILKECRICYKKTNSLDTEKRKRLGQLVKKIGISLKRRFLPLERNYLFHSELAAGAGQRKAEAARPAREENRNFSQKALFAFREKLSFSQRASRWSWTK
jgi:hypothetical protein